MMNPIIPTIGSIAHNSTAKAPPMTSIHNLFITKH